MVFTKIDNHFHSEYTNYTLRNGSLLKGKKLFVPKGSMRENLIQEKHNGSLSRHFGLRKTLDLVERFYFWPKMQNYVRGYVE